MVLINKNSVNTIDLTLTEKSEYYILGVTPYFLFVLDNDGNSNQTKIFTREDDSNLVQRYNRFVIEETTSEDLLNGKIYLTGNTSQWTYKVYESAVPFSADTLDVQYTTGKILEQGRLLLNGVDTNINDIYK